MADKTLNDVVNALNSVEESIKNPPKSAADKEAATEGSLSRWQHPLPWRNWI